MELGSKAVAASGIATQLWQALRHLVPAHEATVQEPSLAEGLGYADAPAFMIGMEQAGLMWCPWMQDAGFRIQAASDLYVAVNSLCHAPEQASLVMVFIDAFGGIVEAIEPLRRLRDCAPQLPLIVMSAEVEGSDFTVERLALCDVTLKTPVGPAALRMAVTEAKANNVIWQARVKDIRHTH